MRPSQRKFGGEVVISDEARVELGDEAVLRYALIALERRAKKEGYRIDKTTLAGEFHESPAPYEVKEWWISKLWRSLTGKPRAVRRFWALRVRAVGDR